MQRNFLTGDYCEKQSYGNAFHGSRVAINSPVSPHWEMTNIQVIAKLLIQNKKQAHSKTPVEVLDEFFIKLNFCIYTIYICRKQF